jgi:hypothetical protein
MAIPTSQAGAGGRRPDILVAIALLVSAGACGPPPHCLGLEVGDTVSVSLIEPCNEHSQFSCSSSTTAPTTCNGDVGFMNGETFTATLTEFLGTDYSCSGGAAASFTTGNWTWTVDPDLQAGEAGPLEGIYQGTNGACMARLQLTIRVRGGKLPSGPAVAGQPAPAVVTFGVMTGASAGDPTCPQSCYGDMAATVAKL